MTTRWRGFRDRADAGRYLASLLGAYAGRSDVLVLALPRGGVPVGAEVAAALGVPLDVYLVRKLGAPGHEELAMGAIASGGVRVLNEDVVSTLRVPQHVIEAVTSREEAELARREQLYRGSQPPPDLRGSTVILVDDGLATGSTMRAAAAALRRQGPARIVVAVPVASAETCAELRSEVDEVICAMTPEPFYAVGVWYQDFSQTSDEEVRDLLQAGAARVAAGGSGRPGLVPQGRGASPGDTAWAAAHAAGARPRGLRGPRGGLRPPDAPRGALRRTPRSSWR